MVLSALGSDISNCGTVFADLVTVADPQTGSSRRKTRIRPISSKDQGELWSREPGERVSRFEVDQYLKTASLESEV